MSVACAVLDPAAGSVAPAEVATAGTWGALLAGAGADARLAVAVLDTGRLASRATMVDALTAVAELLAAVSAGWLTLWRDAGPATGPAAALGRELAAVHGRTVHGCAVQRHDSRSAPASLLRTAARSVLSSADLVATHRSARGGPRSPEAALLTDDATLLGGSGELARLVLAVAQAGSVVSQHAAAAGVAAAQRRRMLPGLRGAAAAAAACAAGTPPLSPRLAGLGVASPSIRVEPSVAQLADRLQRLRRTAWRLAEVPDAAVVTLADLAVCATELNRFATAAGLPTSCDDTWRALARRLGELRTVAPPSAAVRSDVRAVRWLLRSVLAPEQARETVGGAVARLPELAGWNAATFDALAGAGRLYLSGSALRGEEVTDHPDLVAIKLSGRAVLAPHDRVCAIADGYRRAGLSTVIIEDHL